MRYFIVSYIGKYDDNMHFGHEGFAQKRFLSWQQVRDTVCDQIGFDDVLIIGIIEVNAADYATWIASGVGED